MSSAPQRQDLLRLIEQACTDGARLERVCAQIGLSARTVQRWQQPAAQHGDRRVVGLHERTEPPNKLSAFERQTAMALLNGEEFKNLPSSHCCRSNLLLGHYLLANASAWQLLLLVPVCRFCSAAGSWAGRCMTARVRTWPVGCCKTSASAKALHRVSS